MRKTYSSKSESNKYEKKKKNQKDNSYNDTNTIKEIIILTMRAEKMIFMLIKQNIRIDTLYYYL